MTAQGGSPSLKTMLIWRRRRSYFSNAFRRTRSTLQRPAKVLEAIQSLFDDVDTGGVTESDSAIVTESSSRNHRDVGFTEAVDCNCQIVRCLRERCDAHVFRVVVDELLVNFIR